MIYNSDLIKTKLAEKKLSYKDICSVCKISTGTFSGYVNNYAYANDKITNILCSVLGVTEKELLINKERKYRPSELNNTSEGKVTVADLKSTDVLEKKITDVNKQFKEITSYKVEDCFNTVNENIIRLASMVSSLTKKVDDLSKEVENIKGNKDSNNAPASIVKKNANPVNRNGHFVIDSKVVNREDVPSLVDGYSETDSYDTYKNKIYDMTSFICKETKNRFNNVFSKMYSTLRNKYGMVYEQMHKDFKNKYGYKASTNLEAIYDNPLLRSIPYSYIADIAMELYCKDDAGKES